MKLYIGNKNYSTWSLRPWLLLTHFGIPFEEEMALFVGPGWKQRFEEISPAGTVPVLKHGELTVWDSLAIIEYIADSHADLAIWPRDINARAQARALATSMHGGFGQLRGSAPMNLRKPQPGAIPVEKVSADLAMLETMLAPVLTASGGPFLFGDFGGVDAMYAPLATRIDTYGFKVSDRLQAYFDALLSLPAFLTWKQAALKEPWVVAMDEIDGTPDGVIEP